MVIRKLQKSSANTYYIALPKDWIEDQGLMPRDELTVQERDDFLLIYSTKPVNSAPACIEIPESQNLSRDILTAYLAGYDVIRVVPAKGKSEIEQAQFVRDQRRILSGLEITRDLPNLIQLEFFFSLDQLKPGQYLNKCFEMVVWMTRDFLRALATGDKELAETIALRDSEINRTYFLLVRMLRTFVEDPTQRPPLSPTECLDFRMVAAFAEELGDKVSLLCNQLQNCTKMPPKALIKKIIVINEQILATTKVLVSAFLEHDEEKAVEYKNKVKEHRSTLDQIIEEETALIQSQEMLRFIVNFSTRFLDILDDIADLCPYIQ